MDLIKISDTKLKIMLTSSDMAHYDLHNDTISITDRHVRHVLRQLLSDAKDRVGFDIDMNRLYVQMYPGADGGCELFITKHEGDTDCDHRCALPVPSLLSKQGHTPVCNERHPLDMCIYSFLKLEHLISVCKRLSSIGFSGFGDAYADHKHTYFLVLYDFPSPSLYAPDEYCFLSEYGYRENSRSLQGYLYEYCTMLCKEKAVQTFSEL